MQFSVRHFLLPDLVVLHQKNRSHESESVVGSSLDIQSLCKDKLNLNTQTRITCDYGNWIMLINLITKINLNSVINVQFLENRDLCKVHKGGFQIVIFRL